MGAGVGLVEQEHRTEQHRTGVQLVPDALQAGQQAAEEGAVRQTHLTREEEGDEPAGDQKTCRCADVHVLLGPQHEAAGQNDQCRAGAHGGSKLAQHNGEGIQVQDAAAAQGILDGAAHRHGRGVTQGQRRIGLRVAHHLLRPRYRRHGVAHGSGVEGIAAVAAKDLLADQYARQHCHHQHIDVHGGGHEQGDDKAEALV